MESTDKSNKKTVGMTDIIAVVGLALQAYGFFLVYEPLVYIIPGCELLLFAVFAARKR